MTNPATTVEHVAWLRFRSRGDNHNLKWLEVCNSDDERAFKVYRQSDIDVLIAERDQAVKERDAALAEVERLREALILARVIIQQQIPVDVYSQSLSGIDAILNEYSRLENERGGG